MKGITLEQIEHNITEYHDQPRKLKHWQVKKAEYERQMEKAKRQADALEQIRLKKVEVK